MNDGDHVEHSGDDDHGRVEKPKKKLVKAWKIQKLGELCGEHNCYDADYNYDNNIDENRDDDETIQIEIPI